MSRHIARVKVATVMLETFLRGQLQPAESDTPEDAHITLVTMERPDEVTLWVESAKFAEVEDGAEIPIFTPTFRALERK